VPGTADVDHVQVVFLDRPVEMDIEEVQPRCRPPMPQEPWLHVPEGKRLLEKGVVVQVDLADGKIVGRPPVGVHPGELLG
jgi:hypothetical protein